MLFRSEASDLSPEARTRLWQRYATEQLAPRLCGLELMLPSYLVAHMRIAAALEQTGAALGERFRLPFEFLRVYSPSAEVRGHGPGQEVLQTGKREVGIVSLEPVGSYAVQPTFSDGHDTGIYSWDYLHELGTNQERLWQDYLRRMKEAGASRESPQAATTTFVPVKPSGGAKT